MLPSKHPAKLEMVFSLSGKAFVVVENHHIFFAAALIAFEVSQERLDFRTVKKRKTAGFCSIKDFLDRIAFRLRMLTAAMFLTIKAAA
ncbi:MAG: hypothetical protein AAGC95_01785 [Pseudomonadota bacterium]